MIRILDCEKNKIIECAQNRGVEYFVHFTDIDNLEKILLYGLCSRDYLDKNNEAYYYNDEYRLEHCTNAICLSVTSPNYKMFFKLRNDNPEIRWVVLAINAKKVLELDCAFNRTNAANSCMSSIPIKERMTVQAFEDMFYERNDYSRQKMRLEDFETTDPQAEILVFDRIPPSYIEFIHFQSIRDYRAFEQLLLQKGIYGGTSSSFFSCRRDYDYWRM